MEANESGNDNNGKTCRWCNNDHGRNELASQKLGVRVYIVFCSIAHIWNGYLLHGSFWIERLWTTYFFLMDEV